MAEETDKDGVAPNSEPQSLEKTKLEREIRKLELDAKKAEREIRDLDKSPWLRAAFLTALGPAVLSLFGAVASLYFGIYAPRITELRGQVEKSTNDQKDLTKKNQNLEVEIKEQNTRIEGQTSEVAKLSAREKELIDEVTNKEAEKSKLDGEIAALSGQHALDKVELRRLEKERAQVETDVDRLNGELQTIQFKSKVSELDNYSDLLNPVPFHNLVKRMGELYSRNPTAIAAYEEVLKSNLAQLDVSTSVKRLLILHRVTGNNHWKEQLFDVARRHINDGTTDPGSFMLVLDGSYFTKDIDRVAIWNILLDKIDAGQRGGFLLVLFMRNFHTLSFKEPRFVLAQGKLQSPYKEIQETIFRIIKKTREAIEQKRGEAETWLEVLAHVAPAAFVALTATTLADSDLKDDVRQRIIRTLIDCFWPLAATYGFPEGTGKEKWKEWTTKNSQRIDRWLEQDFETFRNNLTVFNEAISMSAFSHCRDHGNPVPIGGLGNRSR